MTKKIHEFDSGVRVHDSHILESQRKRYEEENVHEAEEDEIFQDLVKEILPQGVYVNVGSAIGYYPILAKKKRPSVDVHAYEPLSNFREKFRHNISLNRIDEDGIFIHGEAVGKEEGWARLMNSGYGSRLLDEEVDGVKSLLREGWLSLQAALTSVGISILGDVRFVRKITLDQIAEDIGGDIGLLQMDVQGLEFAVLEGGKRTLQEGVVHAFLIGTHGEKLHQDCKHILNQFGYEMKVDLENPEQQPDGILVA